MVIYSQLSPSITITLQFLLIDDIHFDSLNRSIHRGKKSQLLLAPPCDPLGLSERVIPIQMDVHHFLVKFATMGKLRITHFHLFSH